MSFRWLPLSLAMMLAVSVTACGDDDDDSTVDSGTMTDSGGEEDAGRDTSPPEDTGGGEDAGRDSGTTASQCDPFAGGDCDEGEKCSVVLDIDSAEEVVGIFFGCTDASIAKGRGLPCSLGVDAEPLDGVRARADDCAEGLFCTAIGRPAGSAAVCQTICDQENTDCGEDGYCLGANDDPFFGLCSTASNCDPVYQTGCGPDEGCFTINATNGDLVADCFDWEAEDGFEGIAGDPCMFLNNCAPGNACRPVSETEAECLQFCDATGVMLGGDAGVDAGADAGATDAGDTDAGDGDAGASDAGADAGMDAGMMDAGMDAGPMLSGECDDMELECLPIEPGDVGEVRTPTAPGVCVPPGTM